MSDIRSQQEEWAVCMAQAQRFAARENFFEAIGRARVVRDQVEATLASASDNRQKGRLERFLFQVKAELASLEEKQAAWNARLKDIRARSLAGAAEEMSRPLPNPVD